MENNNEILLDNVEVEIPVVENLIEVPIDELFIEIEEDYDKRLDSDNLITLCRYHHEMAEKGNISRKELQTIIENK